MRDESRQSRLQNYPLNVSQDLQPRLFPLHLNPKREKMRNSAYLPWACRKLGGCISGSLAREQNLYLWRFHEAQNRCVFACSCDDFWTISQRARVAEDRC